ncbi:acyltransferase [Amycolatopsis sp.]|uniref:acyltransferase family protein n=1 Tax=Amycolatopsis sp. TaxID=37632 RepID=UPI002BC89374|nr:acyltransferase [Amycolatopsis sp.]HVV10277.1 acyltransferase [Amycolatopsis sp.]
MSGSAKSTSRKISWDAIRVISVVSVLLGHITHQGPLAHTELDNYPFKVTGQFGAAALMVISGFFVCQTVRRGHSGRWLWKKISRLLPPYLIAVVITYLVMRFASAAFNHQSFDSGWFDTLFGPTSDGVAWASSWYVPVGQDLLINLFMVQGWDQSFIWLDGSYWTLPVQLMVFAAAAALWAGTPWFRSDRSIRLLVWGLILVPLFVRFWVIGVTNPSPWAYGVVFGFGMHRMHVFAAGIAIWLWSRGRLSARHLTFMLIAAVWAQDLHLYPDGVPLPTDPARMPSDIGFAVMLVAICAAAKGPDWTFLRPFARPITWLAGISYGVYLLHQELGYVLARVLQDNGLNGWARLPVLLAAAILGGWLLTVLVERPAHRWLTQPRRPAPKPRTPPDDLVPDGSRTSGNGPAPVSVGGSS